MVRLSWIEDPDVGGYTDRLTSHWKGSDTLHVAFEPIGFRG